MAALTLAGIAYLLAIRECFRGRGARATHRFPRRVVVIGLVLAAGWHIEFLRLPSGADDDIHRYVWDGRLQRLGYNPYLVVPSDPAVRGLHTQETRNLNNPDLPSPYPPGAELFFHAVTAIHESTFALKVAFVVCDLLIVLLLLGVLHRSGQGAHLVLAFAWNPLLAIEVAGSGHIDIVGALLLVVSAAALLRRWRATAAVALGLAIAVKFLPIVLLPLYWKRVRIRDAVLAAVIVGTLVLAISESRPYSSRFAGYVRTNFPLQWSRVCDNGTLGFPAVGSWPRGADRISNRNRVEKSFVKRNGVQRRSARMAAGLLCLGRICLAHGSNSVVRTCCVPMVSALAAAVSDIGVDTADHRLDREHYPHLCPVALAHTRTSVGGASWLGHAGGIRMRGRSGDDSRFATA